MPDELGLSSTHETKWDDYACPSTLCSDEPLRSAQACFDTQSVLVQGAGDLVAAKRLGMCGSRCPL